MKLLIRDDANSVTEWAAKYVIKRINVSWSRSSSSSLENLIDGFTVKVDFSKIFDWQAFHPGPDRYFVLGLPTGCKQPLLLLLQYIWSFFDNQRFYFRTQISFLKAELPLGCIKNWFRFNLWIILKQIPEKILSVCSLAGSQGWQSKLQICEDFQHGRVRRHLWGPSGKLSQVSHFIW